MEKIKQGDFHLISGALNDFGGNNSFDFTCDIDNTQFMHDLVNDAAGAGLIGAGFGAPGGPVGIAVGGAMGATASVLQTTLEGLIDNLPVNVAMPTVPMSPNWVNP